MAQVENDLRGRFQPHHVIKHSLEGIEEKEEDEKCSWRRGISSVPYPKSHELNDLENNSFIFFLLSEVSIVV